MTVKEDQALGRADYWDGRYADGRGHEWFRTFKDLEPFFYENLVGAKQSTPQADPLILHLGSGDSVRSSRPPEAHLNTYHLAVLLTDSLPLPLPSPRLYLPSLPV